MVLEFSDGLTFIRAGYGALINIVPSIEAAAAALVFNGKVIDFHATRSAEGVCVCV